MVETDVGGKLVKLMQHAVVFDYALAFKATN